MNRNFSHVGCIIFISMLLSLAGCAATTQHPRQKISDSIEQRVGNGLSPVVSEQQFQVPAEVTLEDGLAEEEAVALALWNNAQFQADLAQLGFTQADLADARMVNNPVFSLLFPIGPKQLEATVNFPVELLWQRPHRVAYAQLNSNQMAQNLIHHGLSLVQSTLTAYAELDLAEQYAQIMQEEAGLEAEVAAIAESRLRLGDISELEARAIRLTALQAEENLEKFTNQAKIQNLRFRKHLGMIATTSDVSLQSGLPEYAEPMPVDSLVQLAYTARPDLRGAEISIEAAGKRLGWERSKVFTLIGVLDANGEGKEGFEMGPGIQASLPFLNWNPGGRARAAAQMEQALKQYTATRDQIAGEVREAYHNYLSAYQILLLLHNKTVPNAQQASQNAEKSYLEGEISYLEFLDFKRQVLSLRFREAEAIANIRRADAQLRYSVGFKPTAINQD